MKTAAFCLKCHSERDVASKRHVCSKHFYGKKNDPVLYLCDRCYAELKEVLSRFKELRKGLYLAISKAWLTGITPFEVNHMEVRYGEVVS
jgi:hypothetical protein